MDALALLAKPPAKIGSLYVLHGDEPFLKRQVTRALRAQLLGPDADEQSTSVYSGDKADFAQVYDELSTVAFFFPRRMVLIDGADPFVTKYRALLEKRINEMPATGCLVLDVKTWAANTRLAKMVDASAAIACKAPASYRVPQWCADWAKAQYQKQLSSAAASLLVDLVGPDMGLLDQELLKLSIYVGDRAKIDPKDVDTLVGQNRAENTWKIFDALAAGQPGDALALLDRLFEQGEEPLRMVGAFSMQLRRLGLAYRQVKLGNAIPAALEQAGIPPFGLKSAEAQMKHLGRRRLLKLHDWLLELNLDLRGGSPLSARMVLERFLIRLSRRIEPVKN